MSATSAAKRDALSVDDLTASVFTVPTEEPESDGTFTWEATTVVVVEVSAGDERGIGFTYASAGVLERH